MTQPQTPPMMDALAAMRCWAVEIRLTIDGQLEPFRIEAAPADAWLIATIEAGHLSYLPGMLDDEQRDRLMEALSTGGLTTTELRDANRDALEQASGWRWWQASRLIASLTQRWASYGGMLLANGADIHRHSLGMVLGAFYSLLYQGASKKEDRDAFVRALMAPPELDMTDGEWDEEAAEEAVWAMMATAQQGGAT